jgi:hypothetical protein
VLLHPLDIVPPLCPVSACRSIQWRSGGSVARSDTLLEGRRSQTRFLNVPTTCQFLCRQDAHSSGKAIGARMGTECHGSGRSNKPLLWPSGMDQIDQEHSQ